MDSIKTFEDFVGYNCSKKPITSGLHDAGLTGHYTYTYLPYAIELLKSYPDKISKFLEEVQENVVEFLGIDLPTDDISFYGYSLGDIYGFEDYEKMYDELSIILHDLGVRVVFTNDDKLTEYGEHCYAVNFDHDRYVMVDDRHEYGASVIFYMKGDNPKLIKESKSFTDYPQSATKATKKALKYKEDHPDEIKGGTDVGWTRARQLANREPISLDTIKRIKAYYDRSHEDFPVSSDHKGKPWKDAGHVAGLIWGFDGKGKSDFYRWLEDKIEGDGD